MQTFRRMLSKRTSFFLLASVVMWGAGASCTTPNDQYCDPVAINTPCSNLDEPDLTMGGGSVDLANASNDLTGGAGDMAQSDGQVSMPIDPGLAGPYKTATATIKIAVKGGQSEVTIIGPSDDGRTITDRGGPFPTVVLSPGFTVAPSYFTNYGQRLASWGILTALHKVPNEFDHAQYRDNISDLLTWLVTPMGADGMFVRGKVDANKLGVVGHSLGGKASILAAAGDKRVKALMGIDPVDQRTPAARDEIKKISLPMGVPIVFLGEVISKNGGMPCAPAADNYEMLFRAAPTPITAITLVGAAHNDFLDVCGFACAFCPGSTAPQMRTNQLSVKYVAAYFLYALRGDVRALPFIDGAELQKDILAGYVTKANR